MAVCWSHFEDVADQGIIEGRNRHGLDNYAPVYLFEVDDFKIAPEVSVNRGMFF